MRDEEELSAPQALARIGREGDVRAWEVLVDRFGPAMHRAAGAVAPELAADAVQEVLARLPRLAGRFRPRPGSDGEDAVRRWLSRIAVNAALNLRRGEGRRRERERRWAEAGAAAASAADPAWNLTLAEALAALPEKVRRPIVLRYFAGCDDAALSTELGCSPEAARTRLSRALEKLRKRLAPACGLMAVAAIAGRLEAAAAAAPAASPELIIAWQGLAAAPPAPVLPIHLVTGGMSTVTKAMLAACAALVIGLSATLAFVPGSAAETPAPAPGPIDPPTVTGVPDSVHAPNDPQAAVAALDAFAGRLWARLSAGRQGNLFISPYSIHVALAMAMQGARGETLAQMRRVLGVAGEDADFHAAQAGLRAALEPGLVPVTDWVERRVEQRPAFALKVANRLFGAREYPWAPAFLAANERRYGAPLQPMDFLGDAEGSRRMINAWVEERTAERIVDLVPAGGVTPDTRMVLANALHFKAKWTHEFQEGATSEGDFHAPGGVVKAQFMAMEETVPYHLERRVAGEVWAHPGTLIGLPYRGGETECLLYLPRLAKIDPGGLPPAQLATKRVAAKLARVRLELPRIRLEMSASLALAEELIALGMADAFDADKADFTGMGTAGAPRDIFLSQVLHKTILAVDEHGTEAAAATAMVAEGAIPPKPVATVRFDRPFLIAIRHVATGALLFLGRVDDPGRGE